MPDIREEQIHLKRAVSFDPNMNRTKKLTKRRATGGEGIIMKSLKNLFPEAAKKSRAIIIKRGRYDCPLIGRIEAKKKNTIHCIRKNYFHVIVIKIVFI